MIVIHKHNRGGRKCNLCYKHYMSSGSHTYCRHQVHPTQSWKWPSQLLQIQLSQIWRVSFIPIHRLVTVPIDSESMGFLTQLYFCQILFLKGCQAHHLLAELGKCQFVTQHFFDREPFWTISLMFRAMICVWAAGCSACGVCGHKTNTEFMFCLT